MLVGLHLLQVYLGTCGPYLFSDDFVRTYTVRVYTDRQTHGNRTIFVRVRIVLGILSEDYPKISTFSYSLLKGSHPLDTVVIVLFYNAT